MNKTKDVIVGDWIITTNQKSYVLVGDDGVVGITGPNDMTDVMILVLKDTEVDIPRLFYGATTSVSMDKKVTILFEEEEN